MITTITSLFAVYAVNGQTTITLPRENTVIQLPFAQVPQEYQGAFGQICLVPTAEAHCSPIFAGHAVETYAGFTKCDRMGDCCGCEMISCGYGSPLIGIGCNTFSVGDFGAFGVQNINVLGRKEELGGGNIHCFGIEACAESVISASNIASIKGTATGSLRNATVMLNKPVHGFDLDCIGTASCDSAKFEIKIEAPPEGMQCNPDYTASTIQLGSISCYGPNSCKNVNITINNMGCDRIEIQQIGCYDETACVGATFFFLGDIVVDSCHLIGQTDGIPWGLTTVCGLGAGPYTAGEYVHVTYPTKAHMENVQSPSVVVAAGLTPSYPGGKPGGGGYYP